MTINDLLDEMEGFYAYDGGATDSGVKNDARRKEVAEKFDLLTDEDRRVGLSRWVAAAYLSDEGLSKGYGWEDALSFLRWIDLGEYRRVV